MKTKLTRISKRSLAMLLSILMMISVLGFGSLITANAYWWYGGDYRLIGDFNNWAWDSNYLTLSESSGTYSGSMYLYGGSSSETFKFAFLNRNDSGTRFNPYGSSDYELGAGTNYGTDGAQDGKCFYFKRSTLGSASNLYKVTFKIVANQNKPDVSWSKASVSAISPSVSTKNGSTATTSFTTSDTVTIVPGYTGTNIGTVSYTYAYKKSSDSDYTDLGSTATFNPSSAGTYTVKVTATDDGINTSGDGTTNGTATRSSESATTDITVTAAASKYTVTYGKVTNYTSGTVSATVTSGSQVTSGTNVTFTAEPNSNYGFAGWFSSAAGSGTAVSTNASYTKSITSNTTLYAKFVPVVTITAGSVSNGSLSIAYTKPDGTSGTLTSGSATALSGQNVTVTATASNGYYVTKIGSDDVTGTYPDSGSKTYSSVSSSATYTATFAEIPDITFYVCNDGSWSTINYYIYTGKNGSAVGTAWPGATVSGTAIGTINDKNVYQITLPKATYPRSSAKCLILSNNGSEQYSGDGAVSLTDGYIYYTSDNDASEAEEYSASLLDAPSHNVTFTPNPTGGTVKVNDYSTSPQTAREGDTYTIKATPSSGYYVASISNGTTLYTGSESSTGAKTVSGTMSTSDQTVTVTFAKLHYTVSTSGSNFTFTTYSDSARQTPASSFTYNDTVYYTISPSSGYRVSSIKVGSGSATSNSTTGAYNGSFKITANTTVTIGTTQYYTVTVNKGANITSYKTSHASYTGTYTDSSKSFIVDKNSAFNITNIVYATGYEDNSSTNTTNASVTSNVTAELKAKKSTYNITKSVTPSTYASNVTVDSTGQYNDSKSVSVTVPSGYTLSSVKAGSNTVTMSGTTGTVTGSFTMPASAVTLTVTFTAKTQTVAYTAKCGSTTIKTYSNQTANVPTDNTVTAEETVTKDNITYTFSEWQYSGLNGTPTIDNSARTITYRPVEGSNSGSITAVYTETPYTVKVFGRFATDSAQVNWNDTTSSIAFTKTSTVGLYKLDTGKTVYQLSQKIHDSGNYDEVQYFYIKQGDTGYGYSSGGNQTTFQNTSASSKITLSTTNPSSNAMLFNGSDNTKLVTLWYDASTHQIWCTTADQSHSVTFPANGTGYTISNAGTTVNANYGDTVSFTVTPATGYQIDSVTWAGASSSGTAANTEGNTYTFNMPNEDVTTITVTATETAYPGAKDVTYYIDFHNNTLSANPTIKFGSNAAVNLEPVTSDNNANVYSATVSTPYTYHYVTGNANTALSNIDAVINANGNNYDITINKSVIHSGSCECWIESQGTIGTTDVTTRKTTVTNSSSTKRIYMARKNLNWYTSTIYYWKDGETASSAEMKYLGTKTVDSNVTQYYYYYDVPSDVNRVKFQNGTDNTGDYNETEDLWVTGGASDYNCWYLYQSDNANNHIANSPQLKTDPTISTYFTPVTIQAGGTTSIAPEATGTVTYSSDATSVATVASNGTLTAVGAGTATITITATGDFGEEVTSTSGANGTDTVTAETNVTVASGSVTGSFSVMSYDSEQSTYSVNSNNKVKIDSINTVLHGTKANGASATVKGGGIVTSTGSDYTKTYTVKYAKAETTTGYGGLAVRVSFNVTPANDECYFDGWYVGGTKSTTYTSEDDTLRIDGSNYELKFVEQTTTTVTIVYHYDTYDTSSNHIAYDATWASSNDEAQTRSVTDIKVRSNSISDSVAKDLVIDNCPSIINNYYNYKLVTKTRTQDATYGYQVGTITSKACTIDAYLKKSPRKYAVTVNGTRYANKTYTYQASLNIQAGEVDDFNNDDNLIWKVDGQIVASGTNYQFRVTGDTEITAELNNTGQNNVMNGKSIIDFKNYELKYESGVQKLIQNFYIADFFNSDLGDSDNAEFIGGGVLYYAVDKTTGKATKATAADGKGLVSENDLKSVVTRQLNGNYTTDINAAADSTTGVNIRYKQYTDGSSIYKYSQSLQAYQYIFSNKTTNNAKNEDYALRVYAYFIYKVGSEYYVSVSGQCADANFYEAE